MDGTLNLDSLPKPRFRYSPALRKGPLVKTAGWVGLPPNGGGLVPGGAGAEFRQILANLRAFMADNGLDATDLLSATIYTTSFHRFPEIDEVWSAFFASGDAAPTRTTVGVSQLPLHAEVEAEFLFYRPAASA